MPRITPKQQIRAGDVIDGLDFFHEMFPFMAAADGGLGEHSFMVDAVTDRANVEAGAAYTIRDVNYVSADNLDPSGTDCNTINQSGAWERVATTGRTIVTDECHLWVTYSFTASADRLALLPTGVEACSWGIEIDGVVYNCVGGEEETNETFNRTANPFGTIGVQRWAYPVVVEVIIPVMAGTHEAFLVGRSDAGNLANPIKVFSRDGSIYALHHAREQ
jgi:hypothetical protein